MSIPQNNCRKRNQKETQRLEQIRKCDATKERKKVERDNKEKVARKNAAQQAKRNFFGTLIADNIGDTNNAHTDPENNDAIAIEENDDDNVVVIENPLVTVTDSMDVIEKLDFDLDFDDEEASRNNSDDCPDDLLPGIHQKYVDAIQKRVKAEVIRNNTSNDQWLVTHLNNNDWWIRKVHVPMITRKLKKSDHMLNPKREYAAFYRDVYVWVPDFCWQDNSMKLS